MLFSMLLNPATARVSVHYVQVEKRITREQLASLPPEANVVTLKTIKNPQQTYHHVCRDIDVQVEQRDGEQSGQQAPWNNFSYIDCSNRQPWVHELSKQLLLPSSYFENLARATHIHHTSPSTALGNHRAISPLGPSTAAPGSLAMNGTSPGTVSPIDNAETGNGQQPAGVKALGHKRTMSDIPQFDEEEDAESVGSLSLDLSALDSEVLETLQYIVDAVAGEEEPAGSKTETEGSSGHGRFLKFEF